MTSQKEQSSSIDRCFPLLFQASCLLGSPLQVNILGSCQFLCEGQNRQRPFFLLRPNVTELVLECPCRFAFIQATVFSAADEGLELCHGPGCPEEIIKSSSDTKSMTTVSPSGWVFRTSQPLRKVSGQSSGNIKEMQLAGHHQAGSETQQPGTELGQAGRDTGRSHNIKASRDVSLSVRVVSPHGLHRRPFTLHTLSLLTC